jgi:diguanylate cyclase (GGDEF)-like protein
MRYLGRTVALIMIMINAVLWMTSHLNLFVVQTILIIIHAFVSWSMGRHSDQVSYFSKRDFLTGIYNRRFVYGVFPKLQVKADKKHSKLIVVLFDVDNFKHINDLNGHETGDTVLQIISSILKGHLKNNEIIARWGGDEFLMIIHDGHYTETMIDLFCEELVDLCQKLPFVLELSVGSAIYPDDGITLDSLIQIADQSMYRQKISKKVIQITASK